MELDWKKARSLLGEQKNLRPRVIPPLKHPLEFPYPVPEEVKNIRRVDDLPQNLRNLLRELNIAPQVWGFATGLSHEGPLPPFETRRRDQLRQMGLEISSLTQALKEQSRARDLAFSLWPDTPLANFQRAHWESGAYVRFPGGLALPEQSVCAYCLIEKTIAPVAHSVLIFEKDSQGTVVVGSTSPKVIRAPYYLPGVEIFLQENARGTVVLLHSFPPYLESRPIVRARVGTNARLQLLIVTLFPGKTLGRDIEVQVDGQGGEVLLEMSSCSKGQNLSANQVRVVLDAPKTQAEIKTRGLSTEQGRQVSVVNIETTERAAKSEGHLQAMGLLQSPEASYEVIPGLISRVDDVFLDHEAFIGKILEEVVFYLKTRGLSEQEAMFLLIRSHLEPIVRYLPEPLQWEVLKIAEMVVNGQAKEW
jgi:Fe-S cluster assembly protein SufB